MSSCPQLICRPGLPLRTSDTSQSATRTRRVRTRPWALLGDRSRFMTTPSVRTSLPGGIKTARCPKESSDPANPGRNVPTRLSRLRHNCRSACLAEGTGIEPVWLSPSPLSKRAHYRLWQPSVSGGWRNRTPRRVPSPVFRTGRRPFSGTLQAGARKHPSVAATRSTGGRGVGHEAELYRPERLGRLPFRMGI